MNHLNLDYIEQRADSARDSGSMAYAQVLATLAVAERLERLMGVLENQHLDTVDPIMPYIPRESRR